MRRFAAALVVFSSVFVRADDIHEFCTTKSVHLNIPAASMLQVVGLALYWSHDAGGSGLSAKIKNESGKSVKSLSYSVDVTDSRAERIFALQGENEYDDDEEEDQSSGVGTAKADSNTKVPSDRAVLKPFGTLQLHANSGLMSEVCPADLRIVRLEMQFTDESWYRYTEPGWTADASGAAGLFPAKPEACPASFEGEIVVTSAKTATFSSDSPEAGPCINWMNDGFKKVYFNAGLFDGQKTETRTYTVVAIARLQAFKGKEDIEDSSRRKKARDKLVEAAHKHRTVGLLRLVERPNHSLQILSWP